MTFTKFKSLFLCDFRHALVMGQGIHIHWKFMLESNLQHFRESRFNLVLYCEFPLTPIHGVLTISLDITQKVTSFSPRITTKRENCRSRISQFMCLVKSKITLTLDSRKLCSLACMHGLTKQLSWMNGKSAFDRRKEAFIFVSWFWLRDVAKIPWDC